MIPTFVRYFDTTEFSFWKEDFPNVLVVPAFGVEVDFNEKELLKKSQ